MLVSQFSSLLITGMDMPIVAAFDFRFAAFYGVASTLSNALIVPHTAIVSSLLPVAAEISATDDPRRLGRALLKTTRFANAVLCLIALPVVLLMPLFLRIWVGQDYATHALLLGEILIAAQCIRLTMFPYMMIGFAAGQQQRMLLSPILEALTNLAFSITLVRIMGARGVAIGTLIGAVVGVALHLTVSLNRTDSIHVDRPQLIRQGILRPLGFTLPFMLLALVAPGISSAFLHLLLVACAELSLGALLWRFNFDASDHEQILGVLRQFSAAFARSLRRAAPGHS
jgi:O-antigen/teichoic acid export membrane protein